MTHAFPKSLTKTCDFCGRARRTKLYATTTSVIELCRDCYRILKTEVFLYP
jgi:ribosome-binding protein aMBF1 (putative translation factor)